MDHRIGNGLRKKKNERGREMKNKKNVDKKNKKKKYNAPQTHKSMAVYARNSIAGEHVNVEVHCWPIGKNKNRARRYTRFFYYFCFFLFAKLRLLPRDSHTFINQSTLQHLCVCVYIYFIYYTYIYIHIYIYKCV